MMPPLRSFDDVDGRERGQKKTDDLRAMTTLGPRTLLLMKEPGADQGFLERGFICIGEGVRFADFISFFLKYPMKMK